MILGIDVAINILAYTKGRISIDGSLRIQLLIMFAVKLSSFFLFLFNQSQLQDPLIARK